MMCSMNIQFNPKLIKEYRLIGFDNRRDAVADSTIDLEGGELQEAATACWLISKSFRQ